MTIGKVRMADLEPRPLPASAAEVLAAVRAPARLTAHLRLVHDVAARLVARLASACPALAVDRPAVLFGAAVHDIGKAVHVGELSGAGSAHEGAGYELLLRHGVPDDLARFARTHGAWRAGDLTIEDLLVSLADKIWKGRREADLERLVVDLLAVAGGQQPWEAYLILDDILDDLAADAPARIAYQASHPIGPAPSGEG